MPLRANGDAVIYTLIQEVHMDGLVQDCSISSVLAMEILPSFAKSSICKDKMVFLIIP